MLKTIVSNWLLPAILLAVTLLAAYLFGAGWAGVLVLVLICITLAGAVFLILREQGKLYRANRISRAEFLRNALVQVAGILLAMGLASVLGRWVAEAATQQIANGMVKLIAGMIIGLLAGMGVGFLVRQMSGRLAKR